MPFPKLLKLLRSDNRAAALTEFALATPFVLTAGLWGLETSNLAITHMRISQAAMHIADNASRIGETSSLSKRKIYESDINDFFLGSNIQAGEGIELYEFGRVIISSLQVEEGSDPEQQYIAWQRCKGRRNFNSSYGVQDTGKGDPSFVGMGPPGEEVFSLEDEAVMFVEVSYEYQPLVTDAFLEDREITAHAAFTVRANRDLTQIYQRDPNAPDDIARCDIYDAYKSIPEQRRVSGGWGWIFSDDPNAGTAGASGTAQSSAGGSTSGGTSGGSSSSSSGSSGNNNGSSGNGASSGRNDNGNGQWCPSWNWWC